MSKLILLIPILLILASCSSSKDKQDSLFRYKIKDEEISKELDDASLSFNDQDLLTTVFSSLLLFLHLKINAHKYFYRFFHHQEVG